MVQVNVDNMKGTKARLHLKKGVDKVANAVKVTLGPKGRNVVIIANDKNTITKDGVSVAKSIATRNNLKNIGANLIKEVAIDTVNSCGDGTTTATVLAQAILEQGFKYIEAGANPNDVKKGIDYAVIEVAKYLDSISIPVNSNEAIEQVATISANNDNVIGKLIAEAFGKVGKEGVITVEESQGTETYVDVVEGMQFDRGYLSPYFVTDEVKMQSVLEDTYILLADKKITTMQEIMPALEVANQKNKPLLIIAEDVDKQVIATLVVNKLRIGLKVCCVKLPAFGQRSKDMLEDIAILTGGKVLTESNFDTMSEETLGKCDKNITTSFDTIIMNGKGDSESIKFRVDLLNEQIKLTSDSYEKEKLQERLAKLTTGVAVLYVGAASEVEMKEKKDRVDDALGAVKCAVEEGVIPGGGISLFSINKISFEGLNKDEISGVSVILSSLVVPLQTILYNAGLDINQILMDISCKNDYKYGYDAKNECYVENMFKAGIIDPTKVTKTALTNAASIASMILTTECIVDKT